MSKNRQFGIALRRLRRAKGLSLSALATVVGCSIVHMSDIERGRKNPPSAKKIQAMLKLLEAEGELQDMLVLAARSRQSIEISVEDKDDDVANMLVALARRCDDGELDEATAKRIQRILQEKENP